MPIYLDNREVDLAGEALGQVLAAARDHLQPQGRVVVEVELDGQPVGGQDLDARQDEPVGQRELRMTSVDPRRLAVDTLNQVRDRLGEAQGLQETAADLLQQGRQSEALQRVASAIDIWLQTQQAVLHSAVLVGVDLDQIQVQGQDSGHITAQLLERLQELKQNITDGDSVALADALQYEWPAMVGQWDALIVALTGRIEPQA